MDKNPAAPSVQETGLPVSRKGDLTKRQIIEKCVIVFVTAYGLDLLGYFWRVRYFGICDSLAFGEEISHVLLYTGHICFLAVMLLYAWSESKPADKYFFRNNR